MNDSISDPLYTNKKPSLFTEIVSVSFTISISDPINKWGNFNMIKLTTSSY